MKPVDPITKSWNKTCTKYMQYNQLNKMFMSIFYSGKFLMSIKVRLKQEQ